MTNPHRQIREAFEAAQDLTEKFSRSLTPTLDITDNAIFSARCRMTGEHLCIQVATGVVNVLTKLWIATKSAIPHSNNGIPITHDVTHLTQASLVWLIAHETEHVTLGHFELQDGQPTLNLLSRSPNKSRSIDGLPKNVWCKVDPCLELQADHDAVELMLGNYSADGWGDLRMKIASIAAVMVLIETVDEESQIEHSTHPKAAARIFQLLGHVTEMWSIPAHAKAKARGEHIICEDDLPSDEEIQAFSKDVIHPAYWDAVTLAEAADAKSIIADLGSSENFFADITRAKLGQWSALVTVGAKEWADLKGANELILPLLPINQDTN